MVGTNSLLVSTLALGAYCVGPAIGFTPEIQNSRPTHHAPLDAAESASSFLGNLNNPLGSVSSVEDDEINKVASGSDLPPVLQQITDERRNFQMNLGKAMDTLRKDLPYILKDTLGKS